MPPSKKHAVSRSWFLISLYNNRNQDSEEMASASYGARKWGIIQMNQLYIDGVKIHRNEMKKLPMDDFFEEQNIKSIIGL